MNSVLSAVMGAPSACAQSGYRLSKHPQADCQSGLKQGVIDCKDSCTEGCHWYVLQPGHGFDHQIKEFAMGYVRGFCSVVGNEHVGSDADQASWDCNKGPTSASWAGKK
jgi:hypothetical protein